MVEKTPEDFRRNWVLGPSVNICGSRDKIPLIHEDK